MNRLTLRRRSIAASLRLVVVLTLATAVVLPKVSMATATLFGDGYRTVLICTGSQLLRVTMAPDGEVVEDVTEEWVAPHCVLTDQDVAVLNRAWSRADYPQFSSVRTSAPDVLPLPLPRLPGSAVSSRGPPRM